MKAFALDKNNDIIFANNELQLVTGNDQLAQEVKVSLTVAKGEWFLDETEGLNRYSIMRKNPNKDEVREDILEAISDTSEEVVVDSMTFSDIIDRKASVTMTMRKTEDDEIIVSEVDV